MSDRNRRQWRKTLVLLGLGVPLGYAVLDQLTVAATLPANTSGLASAGRQARALPALTVPALPPLGELNETTARPLFRTSRRQPEPEAAPVPPAIAVKSADYTLVGVTLFDGRRIALVRARQGGRVLRLVEEQRLGPWLVAAIGPRRVQLRQGSRRETLRLIDAPRLAPKAAAKKAEPAKKSKPR